MKILSVPSSGKCGNIVAYPSRYGQCQRQLVVPTNRQTPARDYMHGVFGGFAQAWGRRLTQEQRDRWNFAGPQVLSHPRLGQRGPLTGQQHFEQVNCILSRVGLAPLWEPPARVAFGPSPVGQLVITNGEGGVRLFLTVKGEVTTDIMVFGQEPCSAGRQKRRNVSYLGLLPAPKDGLSDITEIYQARYGEPRAGVKVFIVTCQQKDGWKGTEQATSEVVPRRPEGEQVGCEGGNRQKPLMHKGCTRDAQGSSTSVDSPSIEGAKTESGVGAADEGGLEGRKVPGEEGDAPV